MQRYSLEGIEREAAYPLPIIGKVIAFLFFIFYFFSKFGD